MYRVAYYDQRLFTLWPSDSIWWHRSGSPLAQVMACCLTSPSHYLNQYWLPIREVLWHSPRINFTSSAPATILYNNLERYVFKLLPYLSGRVTHICVGKLTNIDSDNGLSPERRQAIIWTNVGILLIGPLGTNFSEFLIGIHTFSFKKMHLKMSSGKWRPFCLGLNVLSNGLLPNRSIPFS